MVKDDLLSGFKALVRVLGKRTEQWALRSSVTRPLKDDNEIHLFR